MARRRGALSRACLRLRVTICLEITLCTARDFPARILIQWRKRRMHGNGGPRTGFAKAIFVVPSLNSRRSPEAEGRLVFRCQILSCWAQILEKFFTVRAAAWPAGR